MPEEAAVVDQNSQFRSTADRARGFAAMLRSGAYEPCDAEMVAQMLETCADELNAVKD